VKEITDKTFAEFLRFFKAIGCLRSLATWAIKQADGRPLEEM